MHTERRSSESSSTPGDDGYGSRIKQLARKLAKLPSHHPLQIASRTYALSLSLSLIPALLPILTSRKNISGKAARLAKTLRNELSPRGFAFAITIAIGGGEALRGLWQWVDSEGTDEERNVLDKYTGKLGRWSKRNPIPPICKTFISCSISSMAAILLLTSRRPSTQSKRADIPFTVPITPSARSTSGRTSATLDLTLMLLVRAFDAILQGEFVRRAEVQIGRQRIEGDNTTSYIHDIRVRAATMTDKVDALAFWVASSRYANRLLNVQLLSTT